jgi:hypothetical protein
MPGGDRRRLRGRGRSRPAALLIAVNRAPESGLAIPSQPTISRLENVADARSLYRIASASSTSSDRLCEVAGLDRARHRGHGRSRARTAGARAFQHARGRALLPADPVGRPASSASSCTWRLLAARAKVSGAENALARHHLHDHPCHVRHDRGARRGAEKVDQARFPRAAAERPSAA